MTALFERLPRALTHREDQVKGLALNLHKFKWRSCMKKYHVIDTEFSGEVTAFESVASYTVVGIGALVALAVILTG